MTRAASPKWIRGEGTGQARNAIPGTLGSRGLNHELQATPAPIEETLYGINEEAREKLLADIEIGDLNAVVGDQKLDEGGVVAFPGSEGSNEYGMGVVNQVLVVGETETVAEHSAVPHVCYEKEGDNVRLETLSAASASDAVSKDGETRMMMRAC
ncbi:hypothetical protein PIB30_052610 [Stylosanthes scabra]|uniref:Uncharacterized protein n=1 Tax=Stylosanthes scabra TaxID=79078 RepID=A0ABU6SIW7_9FABA|nr:hypothetical protein [Stylosanthes scabra]